MDSSKAEFLTIAVVSDLHFLDKASMRGDESRASWLTFSNGRLDNNLWGSLLERIAEDSITADLLLCPGDITTFADESGLIFAWDKLQELATKLSTSAIGVATGNHDLQTRPIEITNPVRDLNKSNDAIGNLKSLEPPYPLVIYPVNDEKTSHSNRVFYFGSDYLIYEEHNDYVLVIFNSCAKHTQSSSDYEKGSIGITTLKWLEKSLREITGRLSAGKICIFLCHHHPFQHEDKGLGSYDFMQNGTELIELLNKYGNWIIIHGHKHHAKISLSGSGSKKIAVFSAGTLSSHKNTLGEGFNNQFYVIKIEKKFARNGLRGTVKAWSWAGNQWVLSKSKKDGIYSGVGFSGYIVLDDIVSSIKDCLQGIVQKDWATLENEISDIKYLTPKDIENLATYLIQENMELIYDTDDRILSVAQYKDSDPV